MQNLKKLVPLLAIVLASGCSSGSAPDVATSPSPSPTVGATPQPNAAQPVKKPTVQGETPPPQKVAGLLQPTNAQAAVNKAQQRISSDKLKRDPFSVLPTQKAASKPTDKKSSFDRPRGFITPPPLPNLPNSRPGGDLLPPAGAPGAAFPPELPAAPQPDLAQAVAVTGVVQVGGEAQAIVQAPNESTSRYVRAGQRLSNGQVLVKRIEIYQGADPVVVLEQFGVEVVKRVGQQAVPADSNNATMVNPTISSVPPVKSSKG